MTQPTIVNVNQENSNKSQSGGSGWGGAISSLFGSLPAVADAVFGESRTLTQDIEQQNRKLKHDAQRSEHDLQRESRVLKGLAEKERFLKSKGIEDYQLRRAIAERKQQEARIARLERDHNRLVNSSDGIRTQMSNVKTLASATAIVETQATIHELLDNTISPVEIAMRLQQGTQEDEMRTQIIDDALSGTDQTSFNQEIDEEYLAAKREIQQQKIIQESASITTRTPAPLVQPPTRPVPRSTVSTAAAAAAPDVVGDDDALEQRFNKLRGRE
jgi:hypothetical protein